MKKIYTTLVFALMATLSFAQENNDTVYVMFDFNQNPWNHPTTGLGSKGWNPDYEDSKGFIMSTTTFDWAITEGSTKKVSVVVTPPEDFDPEDGGKPALMYYGPDYDQAVDGSISATKLWMNPGWTIRFNAPEGYKFGKMIFYFYRNSYFVIDTEEKIKVERDGSVFEETHKIWIPSTPKKNQYDLECWQGDERSVLFDYPYVNSVIEKIDMRLVPDVATGICDKPLTIDHSSLTIYDLQGRRIENAKKGVFISNGKKIVK